MTFSTFVLIYIAGGLTFIPLVLFSILGFSYLAFTKSATTANIKRPSSGNGQKASDTVVSGEDTERSKSLENEPVVTAAYFAVCREYVPGGVNGKPPERSTPAGEVLITESPSVYQSMYRSIFDRGKTQLPSVEGNSKDGKVVRKARNVFFVVLRCVWQQMGWIHGPANP